MDHLLWLAEEDRPPAQLRLPKVAYSELQTRPTPALTALPPAGSRPTVPAGVGSAHRAGRTRSAG